MKNIPIILAALITISCNNSSKETKAMNAIEKTIQLHDFARYNQWANDEYFNWLEKLPEEITEKETISSFPTIKATLLHLWGAEYGWMCALHQKEWTKPYEGDSFNGSFPELVAGFRKTTQEFTAYVESLSEEELKREISLSNNSSSTAQDIILHVINHSTYHRGQIITMARALGDTAPPRADYIYYKRL